MEKYYIGVGCLRHNRMLRKIYEKQKIGSMKCELFMVKYEWNNFNKLMTQ